MKRRCNVKCYGQGDVHEKIVKKLKITPCEGPEVPCVLFVYNVSRETEDLRNAHRWVTEKQGVEREDICVVVLLEKSLDKRNKLVDVAHHRTFDDKTVVVRIIWKLKKNLSGKIRKGPISNRQAMEKVKSSLGKWGVWNGDHCPGAKSIDMRKYTQKMLEELSNPGSGKEPQGGEKLATPSNNIKSSMRVQCNVKCYGQGDIHEKIVKKLKITPCEGPGVPRVLFVYNVSRETEDLQNAHQWVTEKQGVKKEDICAVVLLEKSLDKQNKPVDVAHHGMFNDKTEVVRILWKLRKNSGTKIRKGPESNKQAMEKVKSSIGVC